ncbi:MAG: NAD-dependent deacylase [Deferribacteres bacterium]|nr:NAD-dependent deacylase [Deferribacteres bacterium]
MNSFEERINRAAALIRGAQWVTAFTGAGISTESGISDFRSKGGVWDRYRIVTYQEFISSRRARIEYWKMKKELFTEMKDARPNRAHAVLAELERAGKLKCLVTQNIDGLHQDAGSSNVIELHGTNRKAVCLNCGKQWPIEDIQERLEAGETDPSCDECRGFIKPATVSFGQAMPEQEMIKAYDCALRCDLLIMIGSSLQVEPAASIPREAHRTGAKLIYINRTPTPTDHLAEVLFSEDAGDVMSAVLERLRQ